MSFGCKSSQPTCLTRSEDKIKEKQEARIKSTPPKENLTKGKLNNAQKTIDLVEYISHISSNGIKHISYCHVTFVEDDFTCSTDNIFIHSFHIKIKRLKLPHKAEAAIFVSFSPKKAFSLEPNSHIQLFLKVRKSSHSCNAHHYYSDSRCLCRAFASCESKKGSLVFSGLKRILCRFSLDFLCTHLPWVLRSPQEKEPRPIFPTSFAFKWVRKKF